MSSHIACVLFGYNKGIHRIPVMIELLVVGAILGYFLPLPTFPLLGLCLYLKSRDFEIGPLRDYYKQKLNRIDASSVSKLVFSLISAIKAPSETPEVDLEAAFSK